MQSCVHSHAYAWGTVHLFKSSHYNGIWYVKELMNLLKCNEHTHTVFKHVTCQWNLLTQADIYLNLMQP